MLPKGFLLLEPHTYQKVASIGKQPPSWTSEERGLFSEEPHLVLKENFWDAESRVAIERFYIVDAGTGEVTRCSASMQAYTDEEYRRILGACRFGDMVFYPALDPEAEDSDGGLMAILSRKAPS